MKIMALAHLGARAWFEYIQSDSSWADSASRLLHDDPWAPRNEFLPETMTIPEWPWTGAPTDRLKSVMASLSLNSEQRWESRRWELMTVLGALWCQTWLE